MTNKLILFFTLLLLLNSCQNRKRPLKMEISKVDNESISKSVDISKELLFDKVYGSLVGSAIGDAMGLPTEMWSTYNRVVEYGYIDSLTNVAITPSPEGAWAFNLPAGSTSDDTRWKSLIGDYVVKYNKSFYNHDGPDPYEFAEFVVDAYKKEIDNVKKTDGFNPKLFEENMQRMTFLQEWALVAKPFSEKKLEKYTTALHRFYGGDIVCAGMLYSPLLGLPYPGNPEMAYNAGFRLGIFDQGYARDITALTAAMVGAAMDPSATQKSILGVFINIDPHDFFGSRIFSRQAYYALKDAQYISYEAKSINSIDQVELKIPLGKRDPLYAAQMQHAFNLLDKKQMHISPHSKEILLVTLTAMIFTDFDFKKCMEFTVNYGRDNDTHAAIAGSILGAFVGYKNLPEKIRNQVTTVNKENIGIDLQDLAIKITDAIYSSFRLNK